MLKKETEIQTVFEDHGKPLLSPRGKTSLLAHQSSLFPILFCTLAFVFCVLLSVAPLYRIPDPVVHLETPIGILLTHIGAWLPNDLGLTTDYVGSQINTNMLEFLLLIGIEFVLYGLFAWRIQREPAQHKNRRILYCIWLGTLVAGCIYVLTPATLSHDIIVYASYSRLIVAYHANPYFVPLSAYPQDPFYAIDYWAHVVSAYGPAWLMICAFWGLILSPQPVSYFLAFRVFALTAHLCNMLLVTTILRRMGYSARTVTLGTLLYAWNPLVLFDSSNGGHNDVFMVTLILLGILLSVRAEEKGLTKLRNYLPPILVFTLAALVKFTAIPIIIFFIVLLAIKALHAPLLGRQKAVLHRLRPALVPTLIASAGSGVVALLFYAPFWIHYTLYDIVSSFTSPPSTNFAEFSLYRAVLEWENIHLWSAYNLPSLFLHLFALRQVWTIVDVAILALTMLSGVIWLWYRPTTRTVALATLTTLGALLIVTPWFYSWYVTWLVGLAAICVPVTKGRIGRALLAFALTFSVSAFATYLYLYGYAPIGKWMGLTGLTTVAPPLVAFLLFLAGDMVRSQTSKQATTYSKVEKVGV